jgi:hypothetical protein
MIKSGRRVWVAQAAYNELPVHYRALLDELGVKVAPASSAAKSGMITARGNVYADNMLQQPKPSKGIPGPMTEYGGKKDPVSGLKTRPGDAFIAAEAKALDAELWTLDKPFANRARQQGVRIAPESAIASVDGVEDIAVARKLLQVEMPAPTPTPTPPTAPTPAALPKPGFTPSRVSRLKAGFKAGVKGALSPESLASMIPEMILAIADRVAAREACRTIQVKFIKEGFAKGVAAGVMGWSDEEVDAELKNRITHFRVSGLGDPAGLLNFGYVLQLAEIYENYAVDVGYYFSASKPLQWKHDLRAKGFAVLAKHGYASASEASLFEYAFIDNLAWAIRDTTNAIVGPAIRPN